MLYSLMLPPPNPCHHWKSGYKFNSVKWLSSSQTDATVRIECKHTHKKSLTHQIRLQSIRLWWTLCWCLASVPMPDFGKCAVQPSSMWNPLILRSHRTTIYGPAHAEPLSCDFLFRKRWSKKKKKMRVDKLLCSTCVRMRLNEKSSMRNAAQCLTFVQERRDDVTLPNGCLVNVRYEIFTFIGIRTSGMTTAVHILICLVIQIFIHIQ